MMDETPAPPPDDAGDARPAPGAEPERAEQSATAGIEGLKLGADAQTVALSRVEDNRAAAISLCAQAARRVRIVSRRLDPPVLDVAQICDGLRAAISRQARFEVRILVLDPAGLARAGHALLRLSQDLSSYVDIRVPAETYREYDAFLLLADEVGVLHRPVADRWHAIVSFNDPGRVRSLGREFDRMWETASRDVNLTRMRL